MEEAINTTTTTTTTSLNDLPEHLLLHILSFLPTLDTIPTSLISRKFRYLWSLLPSLDFPYSLFPSYDTPSDTRQFFSESIDRTLILRPQTPILKFRLEFIYDDRYGFHVDSWIRYAVKNGAQEIDLDFFIDKDFQEDFLEDFDDEDTRFYDFPFSVLKNSGVKVLKLCHCDLTLPVNKSDMRLWTITSMFLHQIFLTDEMVSDLLNGCPNLEFLELYSCYGMENWRICSLKLKELSLRVIDCYDSVSEKSVEIDCPNLLSLTLEFVLVHNIYVKDLSSLVKFRIYVWPEFYGYWEMAMRLLGQLPHVKRLIVQNWWLKLLEAKDFFPKSTILYNLNFLHMFTGYSKSDLLGLAAFLELAPNLDTMILDRELRYDGNGRIISDEVIDEQINFKLPSLRQVTIKYYGEPMNELYLMLLLKQQGVVLEKVELIRAFSQ